MENAQKIGTDVSSKETNVYEVNKYCVASGGFLFKLEILDKQVYSSLTTLPLFDKIKSMSRQPSLKSGAIPRKGNGIGNGKRVKA